MAELRRRTLVVTRNFPPLTGGMERLNHHAYLAIRQHSDIAVCGPTGAGPFLDAAELCREVAHSPLSRFLASCQWSAWRLARQHRPDVVYSGSGLTAPAALAAGRATGARVISFLHGLDIVADHPVYRSVFMPAIRRCDRLLVNSQNTARLATEAGIAPERLTVVHPGVEIPDWTTRARVRVGFRERLKLGQRPVLLSAGRLTARKGLIPFLRQAFPQIRRGIPDIAWVIVGGEATQALKHHAGISKELQTAIRDTDAEKHVILLGSVDEQTLSDAYFAADLLVFPVLDLPGDVEGFGMVAIEAAAHGLPTVAFGVGGVLDSVRDGVSGYLVEPGSYDGMAARIIELINRASESEKWASQCLDHATHFTWELFGQRLVTALGLEDNR